mmetsp:Transcript_132231/g.300470  ORF Transcript_132231/g.300470 Transcript_132231/m.300470 type:complete len:219 (+) Transcript_132231:15-671(+)
MSASHAAPASQETLQRMEQGLRRAESFLGVHPRQVTKAFRSAMDDALNECAAGEDVKPALERLRKASDLNFDKFELYMLTLLAVPEDLPEARPSASSDPGLGDREAELDAALSHHRSRVAQLDASSRSAQCLARGLEEAATHLREILPTVKELQEKLGAGGGEEVKAKLAEMRAKVEDLGANPAVPAAQLRAAEEVAEAPAAPASPGTAALLEQALDS